jgi:hypothetical protein
LIPAALGDSTSWKPPHGESGGIGPTRKVAYISQVAQSATPKGFDLGTQLGWLREKKGVYVGSACHGTLREREG